MAAIGRKLSTSGSTLRSMRASTIPSPVPAESPTAPRSRTRRTRAQALQKRERQVARCDEIDRGGGDAGRHRRARIADGHAPRLPDRKQRQRQRDAAHPARTRGRDHRATPGPADHGVSAASKRAHHAVAQVAEHADGCDECHDLRRHQKLAIPLDGVAQAAWRADQLSRHHRRPRRGDAESKRDQQRGQRRRQRRRA